MQTFKSRVDAWMIAIFVTDFVIIAVMFGLVLTLAPGEPLVIAIMGAAAVTVIILPIWLVNSLRYDIGPETLVARLGPIRRRIALADITAIEPSHSLKSGFGLSLDRLAIIHGPDRSLLISPAERDRFVATLRGAIERARRS